MDGVYEVQDKRLKKIQVFLRDSAYSQLRVDGERKLNTVESCFDVLVGQNGRVVSMVEPSLPATQHLVLPLVLVIGRMKVLVPRSHHLSGIRRKCCESNWWRLPSINRVTVAFIIIISSSSGSTNIQCDLSSTESCKALPRVRVGERK